MLYEDTLYTTITSIGLCLKKIFSLLKNKSENTSMNYSYAFMNYVYIHRSTELTSKLDLFYNTCTLLETVRFKYK